MPDSSAEKMPPGTQKSTLGHDKAPAPPAEVQIGDQPLLVRRLSLLVRVSGFLLGVMVTALAAVLLFISISFSDRQIAIDVAEFTKTEYGRTLTAPEGVHLALLPWPSLRTGTASLSEPDRPDAFASWKTARFELEALPLLRRQLVIRHAHVDGLTLRLARNGKGLWSVADLLAAGDPAVVKPFSVQLEGLALSNAGIVVDDAVSGRKLQWREVELGTDALRANRGGRARLIAQLASPDQGVEGKLSVSARYRFGDTLASGTLNGAQARYAGDIGNLKATQATFVLGSADWQQDGWTLADVQLGGVAMLDSFVVEWTAALLNAGKKAAVLQARNASGEIKLRAADGMGPTGQLRLALQELVPAAEAGSSAKLDASWLFRGKDRGSAQGKFRGQLRHDTDAGQLALDGVTGEASFSHPALKAGNAVATLKGDLSWLLAAPREGPRAGLNLDVRFGKDVVRATASLMQNSAAPAPFITVRLDTKRFDLDGVLAPELPALSLPAPADLQGWGLDGVIHADNVILHGMRMATLHVPVKIADGRLSLPAHELQLYGGEINGSIAYDPGKQTLTIFEAAREVQLDVLARDAKVLLPLGGLTNATLDVRSQGASLQALQDHASGVLRLYAKNARWQGIDLPRSMLALQADKPALNDPQSATPLSEVSGAFTVKGPTLFVDKLVARSDVVSLTGSGSIRYASGEMDLALSARGGSGAGSGAVGDKALAALRGQRMLVRIKGRLLLPQVQRDASPAP